MFGLIELQRDDLISLFNENKDLFPDVPRQTTAAVHDIDVDSSNPIKLHPYRTNPQKRVLLQDEVKFMKEHGIAQASCSPWSSMCLLVPKSNGCLFLYRFPQGKCRYKTQFPLPRIDDCAALAPLCL